MHFVGAWSLMCLVQHQTTALYKCAIREQDHKKLLASGKSKKGKNNDEKYFWAPAQRIYGFFFFFLQKGGEQLSTISVDNHVHFC